MNRCTFIEHKGKEILVLNISGCPAETFEEFLRESAAIVRKHSFSSLLVMAICCESVPIPTNKGMFVEYFAQNAPHVKASAVVDLPDREKELLNSILVLAERNLKFFKTADEAKDWLAAID